MEKPKKEPFTNKMHAKAEYSAITKYIALAVSLGLVAADQLIKQWVLASLTSLGRVPVIPGLFYLTYVENRGAAFGIFQGYTGFLTAISLCVLVFALIAILSNQIHSRFLLWSVAIVFAGGAGNCVDRMVLGFVVDYLDFSALFGFPVFNFADCCVVVGTALILLYMIFPPKSASTPVTEPENGEGDLWRL